MISAARIYKTYRYEVGEWEHRTQMSRVRQGSGSFVKITVVTSEFGAIEICDIYGLCCNCAIYRYASRGCDIGIVMWAREIQE